jgi:hypothetical protein
MGKKNKLKNLKFGRRAKVTTKTSCTAETSFLDQNNKYHACSGYARAYIIYYTFYFAITLVIIIQSVLLGISLTNGNTENTESAIPIGLGIFSMGMYNFLPALELFEDIFENPYGSIDPIGRKFSGKKYKLTPEESLKYKELFTSCNSGITCGIDGFYKPVIVKDKLQIHEYGCKRNGAFNEPDSCTYATENNEAIFTSNKNIQAKLNKIKKTTKTTKTPKKITLPPNDPYDFLKDPLKFNKPGGKTSSEELKKIIENTPCNKRNILINNLNDKPNGDDIILGIESLCKTGKLNGVEISKKRKCEWENNECKVKKSWVEEFFWLWNPFTGKFSYPFKNCQACNDNTTCNFVTGGVIATVGFFLTGIACLVCGVISKGRLDETEEDKKDDFFKVEYVFSNLSIGVGVLLSIISVWCGFVTYYCPAGTSVNKIPRDTIYGQWGGWFFLIILTIICIVPSLAVGLSG